MYICLFAGTHSKLFTSGKNYNFNQVLYTKITNKTKNFTKHRKTAKGTKKHMWKNVLFTKHMKRNNVTISIYI